MGSGPIASLEYGVFNLLNGHLCSCIHTDGSGADGMCGIGQNA